jgi:hypothetical protein
MFAEKSVASTLSELTQIQAPDHIPVEDKNAEPWKKIRQYYEDELREFMTSLQNNNLLSTDACNFVYYLFLIGSTLWVLLFYKRVMNPDLLFIYRCILLFLVVNAFVTSTFSTVIFRFQYRVFWILPATNAVVIIKYLTSRRVAARGPYNETLETA